MRPVDMRKIQDASTWLGVVTMIVLCCTLDGLAQERAASTKTEGQGQASHDNPITIVEDPKTVDPATLVSPALAKRVSVRFDGEPLKRVFNWLQQEQSINVVVDYKALESARLLETEPVFEELKDVPLYFLLSRLQHMGLAWYESEDILQITSQSEYLKHDATVPYNLSELIDDGYSAQNLLSMIKRAISSQSDGPANEAGAAVLLGDVVFVRQVAGVHREIAGLLKALQKPARRTFTLDSPRNDQLRSALQQKFSVDFQETPLFAAVVELSRLTGVQIRIDRLAMNRANVRERTPVTLKVTDQKLESLLRGMLSNLGLHWYLQDEALWITSVEAADDFQKTAVFDVRDLCADRAESAALKSAIVAQTRAKWRSDTGSGFFLETPRTGVLAAGNSEAALDEVLKLLEDYRQALKASKPRPFAHLDPAEIVSGYYRLSEPMADSLIRQLPILIEPETWQSPANPHQPGSIVSISSESSSVDAKGNPVPQVILVIRQTRAVHQSVGQFIETLLTSKRVDLDAGLGSRKDDKQPGTFGRNLIRTIDK